jgi:nicotinamidase-related amidase
MATALMLIDAQHNMLEGDAPVPGAGDIRRALQRLLSAAREAGDLVVHVQNDGSAGDPDVPHTSGWELVFPVVGDERVVRKSEPDVFASNPQLATALRDEGVERLVIAGMQSDYCVRASSLGALGLGFTVVLPSGAHATYDDGPNSAAGIAAAVESELSDAGVKVVPLSDVEFG